MLSTPTTKDTDPHSPVIDPAVVLAARADRVASGAGSDAARRALEGPTPTVDTTFRPSDVDALNPGGGRSSIATWAVRTGLAVALAVCSAVGAAAWQTYGDQAQEMIGRWMPRISLSNPAVEKVASPAQPDATAPQAAATEDPAQTPATTAQATDSAASAAPTVPAAAAPSQDSTQLLQSMAHDLAAMGQQIADLKASIAQLKAGQEQMARDMARGSEKAAERTAEAKPFDPKAIEQTLRPRPAPRPAASTVATAAPLHRPRPVYSPPPAQPIAAAPAPMPLPSAPPPPVSSDPGVETVVRPPMPVR
ncbi:hypothetical protein [Bradyrhizobium sp. STM 3557]|uniref:hypothetical protein n=1 Tax=Bradyrhizobium sp. STM 3557 TaxID=578920 RepID=UPI00388E1C3F